eukprot:CAMPEP_0172468200 /NCGR_PEP_ID=MMETSP1065-20121228/60854_1 /TAXON_ID=265537 /ORGANISM="Amphiprora paludosa, Strain CCMP125" /LENGTH=674 /DNA_ID=CAMNT_0013225553 /DNA_START=206 /DNA_END=2230 /DNA_ORIENTATION=+
MPLLTNDSMRVEPQHGKQEQYAKSDTPVDFHFEASCAPLNSTHTKQQSPLHKTSSTLPSTATRSPPSSTRMGHQQNQPARFQSTNSYSMNKKKQINPLRVDPPLSPLAQRRTLREFLAMCKPQPNPHQLSHQQRRHQLHLEQRRKEMRELHQDHSYKTNLTSGPSVSTIAVDISKSARMGSLLSLDVSTGLDPASVSMADPASPPPPPPATEKSTAPPPSPILEGDASDPSFAARSSNSSGRSSFGSLSSTNLTCPYQLRKHDYFDELGYMHFDCKNMVEAQHTALQNGQPLLAIETRIPGDVDAGRDIFSHPLIVEACQTLVTPVVRVVPEEQEDIEQFLKSNNNHPICERAPSGKLCRTKVAFMDPKSGEFLRGPMYGDGLTVATFLSAMCDVLREFKAVVPKYLSLLCDQEMGKVELPNPFYSKNRAPRPRDYTAYFCMEDSAMGEVDFAALEGVFATRAAFIQGRRALEISYDSRKIAYCSLVRQALKLDYVTEGGILYYKTNDERRSAQVEIARAEVEGLNITLEEYKECKVKPDYDPKHALRKTALRFVPLSDIQATRANRLVHLGKFNEAMHLLSPQQGVILMQAMRLNGGRTKHFHEVVDVPILMAWVSVSERKEPPKLTEFYRLDSAPVQGHQQEEKSDEFLPLGDDDDELTEGPASHDFSILTM